MMDRHGTEVNGCEKRSPHVRQPVKRTYTEILHFSSKPARWQETPISKPTPPLNIQTCVISFFISCKRERAPGSLLCEHPH